ncbi:putative tyrosine-protein kinase Wsck isoform X2 [Bombyx mandarina]|uniref:Tyrosine-protein kinase Wsck isoform X1 n=1 Tax=Bombyx mandarina TaxID=7092 RepID=A0A6J2KJ98_BOMMA|nr:putative tyrosine-protein kinase Wsck isoform X1 [Bombyx mandarina]XP_028042140.1 putative tyrosine-protein kinase Wsck isoform X2 [Bombyx mandarina]
MVMIRNCGLETMEKWFQRIFVIILLCFAACLCERGDYIGCYVLKAEEVLNTHTGQSVDACLNACEQVHYKYALIGNESTCFCGNSPGKFKLPLDSCHTVCPKNETQKCGGNNATSVYDTDVVAPGQPSNLVLFNATETTVRLRWSAPDAYSFITSYVIRAAVIETYSDYNLKPLEWRVSNETLNMELLNLHPGSKYNISVAALNYDEEGPNITMVTETVIGTPDPSPPDVQIIQRRGDRMVVHIPKAKNVNGPVSMYRIVISIELYQQGFIVDTLSNHTYATEQGLPYYITAELDPDDIKTDFIIGDRSTYNGFYNAPLPLTNDIDVSLGVVSEKNHVRKVRYAESTKKIILNINEPEEVSPMVVALGAGIAIGVVLLLIGIGLIIILRRRIQFVRMQRGSQSMPLSLSEPCVEIENSGFILEDEERVDYYGNLKRKLWNIPRNLIETDISCVVGVGTYGKFTKGKVQQGGVQTVGLVQVIADRELEKTEKKQMLQELDLLIKTSEHENVISLIGICETNTTLLVVLEDIKKTLKEMLLLSRQRDIQNNKFCSITENKVLQICVQVARGMEYLHTRKIVHKKLCCRNMIISENGTVKIAGFGLSHLRSLHETPDYTRWTSHEMLRQTRYNPKADVWSFGVLMWEVLTLGATPYSHSGNKDVGSRILRGMRPSQPSYVGDELFQVCLQCWQVDPDERPTFSSLVIELTPFSEAPGTRNLSFTHYNGFEFEPHIPQYEVIS